MSNLVRVYEHGFDDYRIERPDGSTVRMSQQDVGAVAEYLRAVDWFTCSDCGGRFGVCRCKEVAR